MTEYLSSGAWWLMKLIQGISALVGGLSMAILWLPTRLMKHGKVLGMMLAGGLSALAGVAFTGIVAAQIGADPKNLDALIGISLVIGATWVACLNMLANTFAKRADQGLDEAVSDIRAGRPAPAKRKTIKRPPAKRVVRKTLKK
jgi:hypothetical protein